VGLAVIILLFPITGYVTKLIQDVQVTRLKKTDARVQTVTESKYLHPYNYAIFIHHIPAMNVLRMIKLFGWEKKTYENVSEKREEELYWIWRRQVLDLISGALK
jgi:hypothetical protein